MRDFVVIGVGASDIVSGMAVSDMWASSGARHGRSSCDVVGASRTLGPACRCPWPLRLRILGIRGIRRSRIGDQSPVLEELVQL